MVCIRFQVSTPAVYRRSPIAKDLFSEDDRLPPSSLELVMKTRTLQRIEQ